MKVFDCVQPWPYKVNFVDENNVILGYDMDRSCCEQFGWSISKEIPTDTKDGQELSDEELKDYRFDPTFNEHGNSNEPRMVHFKIVNSKGNIAYITLYNDHNGYYAHGFDMKCGEQNLYSGNI